VFIRSTAVDLFIYVGI